MTIASPRTTIPTTLCAIDPLLIDCDPTQPRQEIDPEAQADLEASVRETGGVRIPLTVVARGNGRYQLLYGERRLRAAQSSELPAVPCLVFETAPSWMEALDTQLVENLCRAELRPLELAQSLWRRILGANIAALEEEQGDDGSTTAQVLANYRTPTSQIAALEDRLCVLAGVGTVADYFGGGRVRVPRKAILARYGMAGWSESRLKKLFQTLDVAPEVQEMLAGVDVSARALRDLGKRTPDEQADLVQQARTTAANGDGDVGAALRGALEPAKADKKAGKAPKQTILTDDTGDDRDDEQPADLAAKLRSDRAGVNTFTPDPSLALLTSTHGHAPKLVTMQVAPQRGTSPPVRPVGVWSDDAVLLLESALESALTIFDDVGPLLHLADDQAQRVASLWRELGELMQHAMAVAQE